MSKSSELLKNTLIIAVGRISTQFLSFLLLPLYTSILSPSEYGFIDLAVLYIGLLAPTITAQMEMAVFRTLIDARSKSDNRAKSEIISSAISILLTGLTLGVVALLLLGLIFEYKHSQLIIGLFVSLVLVNMSMQIARGLGDNKKYSISSIVIGLTGVTLNLIFLLQLDLGVSGILLASILANLTGTTYLAISIKLYRFIKPSSVTKIMMKSLLNYSWPLIPNHISLWAINGVGRTIVSIALGVASVGIFAAASKLSSIYTALYSIYAMSWTESVSVHIKSKDSFISTASDTTVRLFGSVSAILISSIGVFFPLIIDSDFSGSRSLIPLLILGAFLGSIVTHYGAVYLAVKKTKEVAKVTLQALAISTLMTLATINAIGLYAPALALTSTYLYIAIRRHYDIQQYTIVKYKNSTFIQLALLITVSIALYYVDYPIVSLISLMVVLVGSAFINRKPSLIILGKIKNRFKKEQL